MLPNVANVANAANVANVANVAHFSRAFYASRGNNVAKTIY